MLINFNIGLLGHVDSGKTSLAKLLSSISSTAAFDKNPQSKERGITLDLGFSALQIEAPLHIKEVNPSIQQLQLTFVDCPGHASLIRTIIGGAQIIDLMILVIDAQKGIQTQTAECIVIGELLQRKLIVVVNKVDLLEPTQKEALIKKLETKLRKTLAATRFGNKFPLYPVSATSGEGINELIEGIKSNAFLPERDVEKPLLMYIDHCFSIKGQVLYDIWRTKQRSHMDYIKILNILLLLIACAWITQAHKRKGGGGGGGGGHPAPAPAHPAPAPAHPAPAPARPAPAPAHPAPPRVIIIPIKLQPAHPAPAPPRPAPPPPRPPPAHPPPRPVHPPPRPVHPPPRPAPPPHPPPRPPVHPPAPRPQPAHPAPIKVKPIVVKPIIVKPIIVKPGKHH